MLDELCGLSKGPEPVWVAAPTFSPFLATITPDYPVAAWHGSPNFWTGRNGQDLVAICDHIMQSSIESADSWFKNVASEVSAHFGVALDGRVWQWVKVGNAAWANGITNKSDVGVDWLQQALKEGINPNLLTVSIEHEGYSGQAMPDKQFKATLKLHKFLIAQHNIPIDREHITGHYQYDDVNRHNCPGSGFPFARLMAELSGKIVSQPDDPNVWVPVETGFEVNNDYGFLTYWQTHGGLPIFGYPISGAYYDVGKDRIVQWFERARFENPAKNSDVTKVQLGLVGRELHPV
jgi:N-acetyl-anhydromuramyl-L-alanine amidase AmpD